MTSLKKTLLYGLLVWHIPFGIAFVLFPLRESNRPLFESIMPVLISIVTVLFATLYFKKIDLKSISESIRLGFIWFGICIVIDLLIFMWGPMKMSLYGYMADIGATYLMIPVITFGFGRILLIKAR